MAHHHDRPGDHHSHDHAGHDHGAHDHDHELDLDPDAEWDDADDEDQDEVGLKEAFGLPDELPPLRLPPDADLAATARAVPMLAELAALADWVGDGRTIDADAELSAADKADALSALDMTAERFTFLWKYAGGVDWIEETDDGQVIAGETATLWRGGGGEGVISAWSATFAAVLTEAMCAAAAGDASRPAEIDLHVPGAGLAMMFFMTRREGLTAEEVSEIVEDGLTAELPPGRAQKAWSTWRQVHGTPRPCCLTSSPRSARSPPRPPRMAPSGSPRWRCASCGCSSPTPGSMSRCCRTRRAR